MVEKCRWKLPLANCVQCTTMLEQHYNDHTMSNGNKTNNNNMMMLWQMGMTRNNCNNDKGVMGTGNCKFLEDKNVRVQDQSICLLGPMTILCFGSFPLSFCLHPWTKFFLFFSFVVLICFCFCFLLLFPYVCHFASFLLFSDFVCYHFVYFLLHWRFSFL